MLAPLLLAGLSAGVGFAGMGIDIANSLKAQKANLAEVDAQRDREATKLQLESEVRAHSLARGVGVVEAAAAAAGIGGATVGLAAAAEISSGIRSQKVAELNFQEQMRQLDFAADEIERTGKAERLSAIMGGLSTGVTATQKFIADRKVTV